MDVEANPGPTTARNCPTINQPLELLKNVAQQADTKYRQVAKQPGQSSPPRAVYSKAGKYYNLFGSKYKTLNL